MSRTGASFEGDNEVRLFYAQHFGVANPTGVVSIALSQEFPRNAGIDLCCEPGFPLILISYGEVAHGYPPFLGFTGVALVLTSWLKRGDKTRTYRGDKDFWKCGAISTVSVTPRSQYCIRLGVGDGTYRNLGSENGVHHTILSQFFG